jgi:hypothetical protein
MLVLAVDAASALKLKNGVNKGVVQDGLLLKDVVAGIGKGGNRLQ